MLKNDSWIDFALGSILSFLVIWRRRVLVISSIVRIVRPIFSKKESFMEIASLKKIVTVAATLGNISGEALVDNKIDRKDLALLPSIVPMFTALLAIDFMAIIPEAKDLSQAEAEELVAHFKEAFNIPQDSVEVKIETVLGICVKVSGMVIELIAMFKKPAPAV